jgi:hypothetical protein
MAQGVDPEFKSHYYQKKKKKKKEIIIKELKLVSPSEPLLGNVFQIQV